MFKKKLCQYCGNNPVPHFIHWYFESANVFFTPLRQMLFNNPLSSLMKSLSRRINLPLRLVDLGKLLGILREQNDINFCKISRAKVLWQEAKGRNIDMRELLLFGRPFDVYIAEKSEIRNPKSETNLKSKITNSKFKIIFSGLPRPKGYDNSALNWMDDKWLFKKKLMEYSLPVPAGGSARNFKQAIEIFNSIEKPVIVKPRAGSRGRHSTTFVASRDDLKKALKIAKQLCHWAIIEEQLEGPVYRATLINYQLCGVLRGDSPQIAGDGIHSIKELIAIKNKQEHSGVKDVLIDEAMERFLSRQGLSLKAVAGKDIIVNLSEKIGVNYGGSSSEDFEICHPENKDLLIRAAKAIGDPIVGFDFIIPDITKSWRGQKCGFIEANSLPFINLHHDPLLGTPRNVAAKVWEMVGM